MATDKTPRRARGQRIPYDVSGVRARESAPLHEWRNGAEASADVAPDSFIARVEARRVDLVALVKKGIPPRSYHAHSEGMLIRGKRHMWHGATGDGKSLVCLVHSVRMALAGERIVVLDRENGADEYADRLAQIMNSWKLTEAQRWSAPTQPLVPRVSDAEVERRGRARALSGRRARRGLGRTRQPAHVPLGLRAERARHGRLCTLHVGTPSIRSTRRVSPR